jgi:hypothetical protein
MGFWIWFFPATYLLHILEESFAGERFYNWTGRVIGRRIPVRTFMAMMIAAVFTLQAGGPPWLLPALGTITAANGLGHQAGTLATRSYSPGLFTGLLLWTPLGLAALQLSRPALPAPVWGLGLAAGLIVSGVVVGLAFAVSRKATT